MMKNIEGLKTIALTFLVLFSLFLTWGLWTYQPQYDYVQNTNYVQHVEIGDRKKIFDIIRPTQLVLHQTEQGDVSTMDQNQIGEFMQLLKDAEFINGYMISSSMDRQYFEKRVELKENLEFIYPTAIPGSIFANLFGMEEEDLPLMQINRMIFPLTANENNTLFVYLFSEQEEAVAKMRIDNVNLVELKEKFNKKKESYPKVYALKTGDGNVLFLPSEEVNIPAVTYSVQQLSVNQFKDALFTDPSLVKQYSAKEGEESFTDGARALEVFHSQNKLRYINPTPDVYNMEPKDVILNSIDYVNDHAGWTDNYIFFDWSAIEQSTDFRLFVSGYPAFSLLNDGGATINQTWRNHEIYEYTRSLINLRFAITSQKKQVALPSGEALISYLKQINVNFDSSKLQSITIGYEMQNQIDNNVVISFQPAWYILYDGRWEKVIIIEEGGM